MKVVLGAHCHEFDGGLHGKGSSEKLTMKEKGGCAIKSKVHTAAAAYIISVCQRVVDVRIHVVMVESHEKRVEPNAEHDKEVHERVENEERQELKKQLWAVVVTSYT